MSAGLTAGWPFGARTGTNGLDSINMAGVSTDLIGIGLADGVAPNSKLEVRLDGSLLSSSNDTVLTLSHTRIGQAVASGFGLNQQFRIQNGSGSLVTAGQISSILTTVTAAAEVAELQFRAMLAGTLTTGLKVGGNFIELPANPTSLAAIKLTAASEQDIIKSGGILAFGTSDANDVYLYSGNTSQLYFRLTGGAGSAADVILGKNAALANAATGGFMFIPIFNNTGLPSGAPSYAGQAANHAAMAYNIVDKQICVHNQTAWHRTAVLT